MTRNDHEPRITTADWLNMSWHARMKYQSRMNRERQWQFDDDASVPVHRDELVSAEPARQHVNALFAAGMRLVDIAAAADVSIGVVGNLRRKTRRGQRTTAGAAAALLAVPLPQNAKAAAEGGAS